MEIQLNRSAEVASLNLQQLDGLKTEGQIDVRGHTYRVRFDEARGKFKVRGDNQLENLAAKFGLGRMAKIKTNLNQLEQSRPSRDILPQLRRPEDGGQIRMAMYGMSAERGNMTKELRKDPEFASQVKLETIDEYNFCTGIDAFSVSLENYVQIYELAATGKLSQMIDPERVKGFAELHPGTEASQAEIDAQMEKVQAWCEHLCNNADKLDVSRLLYCGDKDKTLQSLAKNLDPTDVRKLGGLENALKLIDSTMQKMINREPIGNLNKTERRAVEGFIQGAFFRQTSKLGLSFFQQQQSSVMFSWTEPGSGQESMSTEFLSTKPWKEKETRGNFNEAITLSEMRKVMRSGLDQVEGQVIKSKMDQNNQVHRLDERALRV